jgi:biopolymer transport protein ExbD
MANKPSARRNAKESDVPLDLTPMMNLIAILIPCLLISVAFVEVAVAEAFAPGDVERESTAGQSSITVTVTENGYLVSASGLAAGGAPIEVPVPLVEQRIDCRRFLGTVPLPRRRNAGLRPCTAAGEERAARIYDAHRLAEVLAELARRDPAQRQVVVAAEPDVDFEAVIDVMDTSRERVGTDGSRRPMFDQVIFGFAEGR